MPFSSGSEADYWFSKNCVQCQKSYEGSDYEEMPDCEETEKLIDDGKYCPLQWGIEKAQFEDFDVKLLLRIGYNPDGKIASRCLEKVSINAPLGAEKIQVSANQQSLF